MAGDWESPGRILHGAVCTRSPRARRGGGAAARAGARGLPARAVGDGGVLVEPGPDLAGVHLHAVARDRPAVPLRTLALQSRPLEPVLAVTDEDLVDGVELQLEPMSAGELVPQHLDAELALAAQAQDQPFLLGEDLAVRRAVRPVAARLEAGQALGLVAPPPLAAARAGEGG